MHMLISISHHAPAWAWETSNGRPKPRSGAQSVVTPHSSRHTTCQDKGAPSLRRPQCRRGDPRHGITAIAFARPNFTSSGEPLARGARGAVPDTTQKDLSRIGRRAACAEHIVLSGRAAPTCECTDGLAHAKARMRLLGHTLPGKAPCHVSAARTEESVPLFRHTPK